MNRKLPRPLPGDLRAQLKERIAPGLWIDMANNVHWSIPEILDHFGLPNDDEHKELVKATLREALRRTRPDITVFDVE